SLNFRMRAAVALLVLGSFGCAAIVGIEDWDGRGGASNDAATHTSSGPGAMGGGESTSSANAGGSNTGGSNAGGGTCDGQCVPQAPLGWSGPVSFAHGGAVLSCPSAAPDVVPTLGIGMTAAPASCSACTCAPMASCPVDVEMWADSCGGTMIESDALADTQ